MKCTSTTTSTVRVLYECWSSPTSYTIREIYSCNRTVLVRGPSTSGISTSVVQVRRYGGTSLTSKTPTSRRPSAYPSQGVLLSVLLQVENVMFSSKLRLDHIVLGVPSPLSSAIASFERLTGVRPVVGGKHQGLGTQNALVALDHGYLELLARDPSQASDTLPNGAWMAIDSLGKDPKVLTWAVDRSGSGEMQEAVNFARRRGYETGPIQKFRRGALEWSLAYRHYSLEAMGPGMGIVPFLIDWEDSESPAAASPRGCRLLELRAVARDPKVVSEHLRALNIDPSDLKLTAGVANSLTAVLQTPNGIVEL